MAAGFHRKAPTASPSSFAIRPKVHSNRRSKLNVSDACLNRWNYMSLLQLVYLLPLVGLWVFAGLNEPLTMIAIAITLFLAIKTHTLLMYCDQQSKRGVEVPVDFASGLVWYAVWWGLKPSEFFTRRPRQSIDNVELAFAIFKATIGMLLLFLVVPFVFNQWTENEYRDLVAGWLGLVGIAFCMHFGYSHLTAIVLRANGRPVTPIMNRPILAASVSEFWGKRWNLAFRDYAHVVLFAPLARRWGAVAGSMAGFTFSGLIHELAISLPANGGYGWPMLYFVIQGFGVLSERWLAKCGWWKAGSISNRIWAIVVVVLPVPLLFHQPFVRRVIVPILHWCDLSWLLT